MTTLILSKMSYLCKGCGFDLRRPKKLRIRYVHMENLGKSLRMAECPQCKALKYRRYTLVEEDPDCDGDVDLDDLGSFEPFVDFGDDK